VDQTIEKVSFCAPDRNHEKGFSYICRDGTTRRWMCHGFLALKESVSTFSMKFLNGASLLIKNGNILYIFFNLTLILMSFHYMNIYTLLHLFLTKPEA